MKSSSANCKNLKCGGKHSTRLFRAIKTLSTGDSLLVSLSHEHLFVLLTNVIIAFWRAKRYHCRYLTTRDVDIGGSGLDDIIHFSTLVSEVARCDCRLFVIFLGIRSSAMSALEL